jgi:branched-chain amino acid transport system ATP-binding protein
MPILEIQGITKRYGGLTAVKNVSFSVEKVLYDGQTITGLPPHEVARRGVVRTFQETTIFKEMTALQNVIVAHQLLCRASSLGIYFGSPKARADEASFADRAIEILDYLGLGAVKHLRAQPSPWPSARTRYRDCHGSRTETVIAR